MCYVLDQPAEYEFLHVECSKDTPWIETINKNEKKIILNQTHFFLKYDVQYKEFILC